MGASPVQATASPSAADVIEALDEARERTLGLVASVSDEDLERVHSKLMSPLVWDLGHIAAFEDLWLVHRYGARPLLREGLADIYDAFETPRANRGELPFLRPAEAREYLKEVRGRTLEVIGDRGIGDGRIYELVIRHEHQHNETMLQTLQLARLSGYRLPVSRQVSESATDAGDATGLELIEVAAGDCTVGVAADGFAYDNERPRQRTATGDYLIGRTPITNAAYLEFVEGGGYRRRKWWTPEGWAWKERHDINRPGAWTADLGSEWRLSGLHPLDPARPVVHISWFEADAFARAHDVRLPTEVEWEKAATWDQERGRALAHPWGDHDVQPGIHANLDQLHGGTAPVHAHPGGASPYGCLDMTGDVWEWTGSSFGGYPGFVADPYPEYSQVFFGPDFKVLRGGSWASRARICTPTFRNWDYPERRQIFAGMRIARDK
jgi:iron(II)-dependent oxidoreductase